MLQHLANSKEFSNINIILAFSEVYKFELRTGSLFSGIITHDNSNRYRIQFNSIEFKIFNADQNKKQQFSFNEGSAKASLYEAGPSN